ncbi:hypothetical protein [Limnoglobus roseus]|uniref:Uncharacterized protein n=1 Tax=Limnoglobus roseus TaxID=2598579 RepID=A0A5C1AT28_9BACT|nr:hypothetical protein [Limnoglobus roseus]QEL20742.1 hypothetical protein PX52LOC_07852 [Limnoglobus roseus]
MRSFFNRRPSGARPDLRARLAVEPLGALVLPTGVTPVINNFVAHEASNGFFVISGTVADDQPAGLSVTFGGGMTGIDGQHATTASDGSFSFTVFVGSGQSGMVTATVTDGDQNVSPEVEDDVHPTGSPETPEGTKDVPDTDRG